MLAMARAVYSEKGWRRHAWPWCCTAPTRAVVSFRVVVGGGKRSMPDGLEDANVALLDAAALATLHDLIGDDREGLGDIVGAFLEDAPAQIAELQRGLERDDVQLIRRIAHTLKGNASTFGALDLAQACRELEEAAKGDSLGSAATMAAEIEARWRVARPAIEALTAGGAR